MPLINYKINLDLNWYKQCAVVATDVADQGATYSITDTKLYVTVNEKIMQNCLNN